MIGEKVYLRILEASDIPTTQAWINDPEISEIMGYLPVKSQLQQKQWYEALINDQSRFVFAICLLESKEHIGNVALGNVDYVNRNAAVSIFIMKTGIRGNGYGTEAMRLILWFAFDRLNLHRVYLRTSPEFVAAVRMYESLGFVQEGILREHYFVRGKYRDKIIYSMLRSEYSKNSALTATIQNRTRSAFSPDSHHQANHPEYRYHEDESST